MKFTKKNIRFVLLLAGLLVAGAALASCTSTNLPATTDEVTKAPGELVTEPVTTPADGLPNLQEGGEVIHFQNVAVPNYADYTSAARIAEAMKDTGAIAFAKGGNRVYVNNGYQTADGLVMEDDIVNAAAFNALTGKSVKGTTPAEIAAELNMSLLVYDNRLYILTPGTTVFDTYRDCYTLEALRLQLVSADETEIRNALIDLPNQISNGTSNAVYYNAPDLHLGVQTSVYFQTLGQTNGVTPGPSLVAGEGKNAANHTVVRVFNQQQACTAQFLAFDASVTGGVQVAAGCTTTTIGKEVLIATAAFDNTTGKAGTVRVFDTFGTLRMELSPAGIEAPYTIVTGHFLSSTEDDVLMVTTATLTENGRKIFYFYSLSDGSLLRSFALDCSFAPAGETVQVSKRENAEGVDNMILFFAGRKEAYEGNADDVAFAWSGVQLPLNATGVYASSRAGEKYIVTIAKTKEEANISYVTVYDTTSGEWGKLMDVGFKENVLYATLAEDNNFSYVDHGNFQHIRTDLSNGVMGKLNSASSSAKVDDIFDTATVGDYTFGAGGYANMLRGEHCFLEPCFTHRWNKISGTTALAKYTDENGNQLYVSVGKDGKYVDYNEIGSEFYVGTYADGVVDLAKLRILPLRTGLQSLATTFRNAGVAQNLIGISPLHEQEINVEGSVGDYNINMIQGFANYLLDLYGSVDAINAHFGTNFASAAEIDAPRDGAQGERGDWDKYSGDYFQQWSLYNRYVINKRMMEAYREAMLAGFPPESISAHQIPEGDAVSGFLGQADTRISPVDLLMSCGTAFGTTRYGSFYANKYNFFAIAAASGHRSSTIGEYCALSDNAKLTLKQLQYLQQNGLAMVVALTFTDAQTNAEKIAVDKLAATNTPRPGYAGGTSGALGVTNKDGSSYNIVQLTGSDEGLLKSINTDGTWEGSVYLVPFHSQVNVSAIEMKDGSTGVITGLQSGDQIEVSLTAAYTGTGSASVTFEVYNGGYRVEGATVTYALSATNGYYRYCLSNQLAPEGTEIRVTFHAEDESKLTKGDISAVLETEAVGRKYFSGEKAALAASKAHVGGVTFDIIDLH